MLQLRTDLVEPGEAHGMWAPVAATCADESTALCISGGTGTGSDPQLVRVKLSASPQRVKFV